MFSVGAATRIYLAPGATDMRKSYDGLYGLVRDQLLCDPLSGHVFLFSNAQRNRLKIKGEANPFDPRWRSYFAQRARGSTVRQTVADDRLSTPEGLHMA